MGKSAFKRFQNGENMNGWKTMGRDLFMSEARRLTCLEFDNWRKTNNPHILSIQTDQAYSRWEENPHYFRIDILYEYENKVPPEKISGEDKLRELNLHIDNLYEFINNGKCPSDIGLNTLVCDKDETDKEICKSCWEYALRRKYDK